MGLAAKLAAGGATYAAVNSAADQYGQHHQQHGAPPMPAAPPQPADNSAFAPLIADKLNKIVAANALQTFYSPAGIQTLTAQILKVDFRALAARWRMPVELALDLAPLALYDIVIYADDSASMKFAEKGTRIDDLKAILERVTEVATLFDADGISIRCMNANVQADNVRTTDEAAKFATALRYDGATPLGSAMDKRIIEPLLEKPLKSKGLRKPLLVITITDGEPTGERPDKIRSVIKDAKKHAAKSKFGAGAIAFEFAQVGTDQGAQAFLARLDKDKDVGKVVDCTSHYELEQDEMKRKGVDLTPDMWMLKLMVGAIDRSYDEGDE